MQTILTRAHGKPLTEFARQVHITSELERIPCMRNIRPALHNSRQLIDLGAMHNRGQVHCLIGGPIVAIGRQGVGKNIVDRLVYMTIICNVCDLVERGSGVQYDTAVDATGG